MLPIRFAMSGLRPSVFVLACALACGAVACGEGSPRMQLGSSHVRAGDRVVVRFTRAPAEGLARGAVWLSLVPAGSSDAFLGERVVLEASDLEATIATASPGTYELHLVDASPRRWSSVVERMRVDVQGAVVASAAEPPAWYW